MPALFTTPNRFYDLTDIYDATDYDPDDESTGWDEDEDEDDGETDVKGEPVAGRNDAVRCPCPPLAEYPPAGWLSLDQHDTLADLAGFPGSRTDDNAVWIPAALAFEASLRVGVPVRTFETVFEPGYWFSFPN